MDENQKEVTPPSPPERQAATGHSVSAFRGLSADRWVDWINSFLSSSAHSPTITIGREELHHILIRIYDNLETQQDRGSFETALTLLFESTQTLQDNAERLYYLLQLLAYAKPPRAKRIVRRLLFDEVLTDVHFGEQHLHWMLLTTSSEYDVDDEIVDYVHRSVRRLNDFKYALLCLRILSSRGGKEAVSLLDEVIPLMHGDGKASQLARQLKAMTLRNGFKYVCEWYLTDGPRVASKWPEHMRVFEDTLRKGMLKWAIQSQDPSDPHRMLLSASLHAGNHRFAPADILTITRLKRQVGDPLVHAILEKLWNASVERWPDELPWTLLDPMDNITDRMNRRIRDYRIVNRLGEVVLEENEDRDSIITLLEPPPLVRTARTGSS